MLVRIKCCLNFWKTFERPRANNQMKFARTFNNAKQNLASPFSRNNSYILNESLCNFVQNVILFICIENPQNLWISSNVDVVCFPFTQYCIGAIRQLAVSSLYFCGRCLWLWFFFSVNGRWIHRCMLCQS